MSPRFLACARPGCLLLAAGRCVESNQPYCEAHLHRHSATGSRHETRDFPLALLPPHTRCPECSKPVKVVDGGSLIACRSHEKCGWSEVVEAEAAA